LALIVIEGRPADGHAGAGVDTGVGPTPPPRYLKLCVVGLDSVAIGLGMLGAGAMSRLVHPFDDHGATAVSLLLALISVPLWLGIFARYGLYKARRVTARLDEIEALVHASVISTLMMAALSYLLQQSVSRSWLVLCLPTGFGACLIEREAVRGTFRRLRCSGRLLRRVVLVGANSEAESLCELLHMPELGYQVVGVVDDGDCDQLGQIPVLGRVADTLDVVRATDATGVMVATTALTAADSNWLVRGLIDAGVHVEMSSSLRGIVAGRLRVRSLGTTPVVYVEPVCRGGWRALAKRVFDLAGAGLGLLLLALPFALVAVAIKLDSRGPVFFSQVRVGRLGKPFRLLKFRSMVPDAEALISGIVALNEADGPLFKIKDDPRVTRVGRVLRRLSIDELPQLVNVLRSEMSLVGPRPALPAEMDSWGPELRERLRVRPGLTGLWQVKGRSDLGFADYIRYDLYYVENWSLWCDLAILAKTIPVLLRNRGAY
jgi:exopolysaccharide biosynthesis polyprenyl glycosylphosphotransferase